jgi:aflatoxin B1 aldehyde reductase
VYGFGSSELYLGQLKWQDRGMIMGTKLNARGTYSHKKDSVKPGLLESLKALQTDKVDLWYLHAPDVSIFTFF